MESAWLTFFGRLHPLLLHLPIGLFIGLAMYESLAALRGKPAAPQPLVFVAALAGVLAAAAGWQLQEEPGYGGTRVEWHEWLGIGTAGAGLGCWLLHAASSVSTYRKALGFTVLLMVPTAHLGASMTHGQDYLLEPFQDDEPREPGPPPFEGLGLPPLWIEELEPGVPIALSVSFGQHVQPIIRARCTACHGARKRKGRLRLDSAEQILAGGGAGAVISPGDPGDSELHYRMSLPLGDEDRMPPEGKPQHTVAELALIEAWISAGAPIEGTFELAPEVVLPLPVALDEIEQEALETASPGALAALRDRLVHVSPISAGSAELWIDFAAPAADISDQDVLELLEAVRAQVAELSLARTGVGDDFGALAADMPSLRRLDLRDTAFGDAGLARLGEHPTLEELVLVHTPASDAAVGSLLALPALKKVWVWDSGLTDEAVARLRAERPELLVDAGDVGPALALETEGELILGDGPPADRVADLSPVNEFCPVTGSPVDPVYSVVFEGQVIGFCCPNCPKSFWEQPESFRDKLPGAQAD